MKLNANYYGSPKQIYHNSYPYLQNNRSSSLNNTSNLSHPISLQQKTITRPENINSGFIAREITRNNLSNSQASHQQLKIKIAPQDYYPSYPTLDQTYSQIQEKIQELARKVNKNTQDIKKIKQNQKKDSLVSDIQGNFCKKVEYLQQKYAVFNEQCLLKIVQVRQELLQLSSKNQIIQKRISKQIQSTIQDKFLIKLINLIEQRMEEQRAKIKAKIQKDMAKLTNDLRRLQKIQTIQSNPIKSILKYPFKSIKLNYNQFLEATQPSLKKSRMSTNQSSQSPKSRHIFSSEVVYYIDREGYLLDEDNYYLLDQNQNMIRLHQNMISQLTKEGIMKQ